MRRAVSSAGKVAGIGGEFKRRSGGGGVKARIRRPPKARIGVCEVWKVRQLSPRPPTGLLTPLIDALTIAKTCAKIADEIHAEEIVVLDLRGISNLADFFVICTSTSVPHLKAAARDIRHNTE